MRLAPVSGRIHSISNEAVSADGPDAGDFQRRGDRVLNADRLTIKASEAIQSAVAEAQRRGNPSLEDVHLLRALLEQEGTIAVPILQKVGVRIAQLEEELERALSRLPKQSGGVMPSVSRELNQIFGRAEEEARGLGDEYISTEHLLIALAAQKGSTTRDLLGAQGATREALLTALEAVRGPHRVTEHAPVDEFRSLRLLVRDRHAYDLQGSVD